MITKVVIKRFKRFPEVVFDIPGHVVLAGPNNTGKTTLLQAIAAWDLAFRKWCELNEFQRRGGAYGYAPIARQAFAAVPLRQFDLLWNQRNTHGNIEIEISHSLGWRVTMEFFHDTTEQVKVRPKQDADPALLKALKLSTVFVPPITGLNTQEPLYARQEYLDSTIGQGKPGEVLRNLLVQAKHNETAWHALQDAIQRLFGYELLPPDEMGTYIIAEYRTAPGGPRFDIASAGSGFQQVLMLLTFLNTRPGSVLLIDEPDAHLHIILQEAIYGELRHVALDKQSQLIIATHSEVIIDSVEPRELFVLFDGPRRIADTQDRTNLIRSLSVLSNTDIMMAMVSPGVLYTEGYTDIAILKEWARILNHPANDILSSHLYWRPTVWEIRQGAPGIRAKDHYDALAMVKVIPGLVLLDGDDLSAIPDTPLTGTGLQRIRWGRYEIESYLIHPAALERFISHQVGESASGPYLEEMKRYLNDNFPPAILREPLGDHAFLNTTKARTKLLPPILDAAGLHGFPYTRYHEIAACMLTGEIHPEIKEKLDAICKAFNIPL
ncbi:MAG: ATP-dependent nuclease [Nitrospirota bacterium]